MSSGAPDMGASNSMRRPLGVAVFASGGGTNFQALLDHQATQELWRIRLLIMNRDAGAAERARAAHVPVRIIPTRDRDASEVATETLDALDAHGVDVVLLSGYLRLLPPAVVTRFAGRILNIHPALLPAFGGKGMYGRRVHEAVVEAGVPESGATVHYVTAEYDEGGVLGQARVPVLPGDDGEALGARVLAVEHRLYPAAVDHLCTALLGGREPERMQDIEYHTPSKTEERA